MSATPPPLATNQDLSPENGLSALRAEVDRLDDALHELLMQRAAVVERVAAVKGGGLALRPGREAQIIRRLLARHSGRLPQQSIVRIWRELLAATCAMQGNFVLAVCEPGEAFAFTQLAREHFGALTPLRQHPSPAQAIAEVSAGSASLAILPPPEEAAQGAGAWWQALLHRDNPRMYIIARLPFWLNRPEGAPRVTAFVVAAAAPDPSGDDRSMLGLEVPSELSRARVNAAFQAAGFSVGQILLCRPSSEALARLLVDVEGHVTSDDPRLAALARELGPAVVLGGYAVPIRAESP
ncbi:MAG: chorismate mutase [Acidobacteriia bacterium]|nr:chorismate mutase [Methyloceanibacter sp.]MCL6491866.1 chorismate mutase [Terriglobia bacterium]